MNLKQRYAILKSYEKKILDICLDMQHQSGIYMFYRTNEEQKICVYIGQSVDMLKRCCEHLSVKVKKQHIDKSLAKHGLYSESNPNGWKVKWLCLCAECNLDYFEQKYIEHYKNVEIFKLYNVTGGGQFDKAEDINERHEVKLKSYKNGKSIAEKKIKAQVRNYFDKYLDFVIKGKTNKIKERKFEEFKRWVYEETNKGDC